MNYSLTNIGRKTIYVSSIGGKYKKKSGGEFFLIITKRQLPHKLDPGETFSEYIDNIDLPDDSYDAIWSMNALLHVPKKNLLIVLENLRRVLKSGGLFYLGIYGGYNSEAIWEEDPYTPKRFFSFFTHTDLQGEIGKYLKLLSSM